MSNSTGIEGCYLTYLLPESNTTLVCLSCKENKYLMNNTCTGEAVGTFKGCLTGTATACDLCNPYFDYVMRSPGVCEKRIAITNTGVFPDKDAPNQAT